MTLNTYREIASGERVRLVGGRKLSVTILSLETGERRSELVADFLVRFRPVEKARHVAPIESAP